MLERTEETGRGEEGGAKRERERKRERGKPDLKGGRQTGKGWAGASWD